LLLIQDVQDRATHDALQQQRWSLLAREARLTAEHADGQQIEWPAELDAPDPVVRKIVLAQQQIFETRRTAHAMKKAVLRQRVEQLHEQIKGIRAQVESTGYQLEYVDEEVEAKRYLLDKGLVSKPEFLSRKRTHAELAGKRGEELADIARAEQQIGETEMQLLSADAERSDQIANETDKVRADLRDVTEKLRASDDVLKRKVVTAPVEGTIVNLKFKTIGAVIQRGEPIVEIVPSDDALVIEARVTPLDVKAVHDGLQAQIHLSAYSSRTTPRIPGIVQSVSADRILDQNTHEPYYLARVAVNRELLHSLAPHVHLVSGMPAEVLIITEHRSMFDYLFKPFRDAFRRSFHEV
jgi:HlyD family secretion protein